MRNILLTLSILSASIATAWGQSATTPSYVVTQEEMLPVFQASLTPFKYGLVIAPTDNKHKIDCPTVYREGDKWYMTYVVYDGQGGKDGRGYETWLAESPDLLHWETLGRVLSFIGEDLNHEATDVNPDPYIDSLRWDANQRGGFPSLLDWNWAGSYRLQEYNRRHWMTYLGGAGTGYEGVRGPLHIGLAWTEGDITTAHEWETLNRPIISERDADSQWFEQLIQYKSMVYLDEDKSLGTNFVMFYNAGGINPETNYKGERIGVATSNDMRIWKRYPGNPVFTHESQGIITGDAQIQKMYIKDGVVLDNPSYLERQGAQRLYTMFYFSAFNPTREYKAYNTFACSKDLVHWYDWEGPDLIKPSEEFDSFFAHKSFVVKHDGVVYHFYCAVNQPQQRGIAVATSEDMGESEVHFPEPPVKKK